MQNLMFVWWIVWFSDVGVELCLCIALRINKLKCSTVSFLTKSFEVTQFNRIHNPVSCDEDEWCFLLNLISFEKLYYYFFWRSNWAKWSHHLSASLFSWWVNRCAVRVQQMRWGILHSNSGYIWLQLLFELSTMNM